MAQREKQKNPCANCGHPFEVHPISGRAICSGYLEQMIFRASPSSVKSYGECQRKWAARALGGVRAQETPAQAFGTKLHGMAETYLATHEIPDQDTPEGRLFVEGIPFLPKRLLLPGEIEGEIGFNFDGVPWLGYYDWKLFAEKQIGDHKTSADPKKWGLSANQLPDDIQACSYAYDTGWDVTHCRWLYYGKTKKNAFPVDAKITRSQAEKTLKRYTPIALEMQKLFDANPALLTIDQLNQIPNNPSACGFCGRNCDFAESCTLIKPSALVRPKLTPHEMKQVKAQNMNAQDKIAEIRAKLAAKKNGSTVNPPEAAAAVEETVNEVANEVPQATPETEPEPAAEPVKRGPGRPKKEVTPAPEVAAELPAPTTPEMGKVQLDLASLGIIAANLPAGVKLTLTLG